VIPTSSSGRWTGGTHSEQDQGCKEGGQTTPSWNAIAVLECEQLYADAHCHGEALHQMSAFNAFSSEWPYAVFSVFHNAKCGWAHRWQISLTHAYKNLFPNTSASITLVTMLRSSLSMYIFFVYNKIFFIVACFVNSSPKVTSWIALISVDSLRRGPKLIIIYNAIIPQC
jgi:hypothetical protein